MRAVLGDSVKFVKLVFAKAFGAESGNAKTEARQNQNHKCGKDKCPAISEKAASGKQLWP